MKGKQTQQPQNEQDNTNEQEQSEHFDPLSFIDTTHLAAQQGEPVWLLYKPS